MGGDDDPDDDPDDDSASGADGGASCDDGEEEDDMNPFQATEKRIAGRSVILRRRAATAGAALGSVAPLLR